MTIDNLINQAIAPKQVDYNSPKVDLWEENTKEFVKNNYGQKYIEIFDKAMRWNQVAASNLHAQKMHVNSIEKAIEFLESIKDYPKIQIVKENFKSIEKIHSETPQNTKFGNIVISGSTVIIRDNRINKIYTRDIIRALGKEIEEKVPESKEKHSVLKNLKEITNNQTFASIAGAFIGEIIKRFIK